MGIKKQFCGLAGYRCFSVGVVILLSATSSFGANADLTGWVGTNNTTGSNNYSVTGPSSAGGTFIDRPAVQSSLVDTTLIDPSDNVTPLVVNWNSSVSMSGTIAFSTSAGVDPTLFFGWYNSSTTYERLGFGFADQAGHDNTYLRIMTQTTSQANSIASLGIFGSIVNNDVKTLNAPSTLPSGTYPFTFMYDGEGHMAGTFGVDASNVPIPWSRNFPFPNATGNQQNMDTFGFLQTSIAGTCCSFSLTVSSVSYTGQTDVSGGGAVAADYNHNGVVDAADYVVWRDGNIAADGTGPGGTPDGLVNALDYNFWRSHFGNTSGSGSTLGANSAVPEPATLALALLSFVMILVARGRTGVKQ